MNDEKLAIVVFNLGGPDAPESVRPFLFNLFNDPAIIRLPTLLRWPIAQFISRARAPVSREIYSRIGGHSNLLPHTMTQANALKEELASVAGQVEVFVYMRYWKPMAADVVRQIREFGPDRIFMLPLYPQFSTTTTGTSLAAFEKEADRQGLNVPRQSICCYPSHSGFIDATVANLRSAIAEARSCGKPRILLSAHSLPEQTVKAGDPYQWQVEVTARSIVDALDEPDLDWSICYQSRVGPLKWIGPMLEDEIVRAGRDSVPVIVVPIAFVSEHVETLVEVEIEARELADECGVPSFHRVAAVAADCKFIAGLGDLVRKNIQTLSTCSDIGARRCPAEFKYCPNSFGRNQSA